jgi:hypothetical protein
MKYLWMFFLCSLVGCASNPAPPIDDVYTLAQIEVHLVSSPEQIPYKLPDKDEVVVFGLCWGKRIWVLVKEDSNGVLWPKTETLGHEIQHVLNRMTNGRVGNPDKSPAWILWH